MRVLHVTASGRTEGWLKNALTFDSATEIELHEARGATEALETLRDEVFDAILVSHQADDFDALEFVAGLRAGGTEEPVVILGTDDEFEITPLCYEVGGDGYVCVNTATVRMFLWVLARAVERHQLLRENRRLLQGERQRLRHEHQEADRLLCQQRALIADLESLREPTASEPDATLDSPNESPESNELKAAATAASPDGAACDLPPQLIAHYRGHTSSWALEIWRAR
jgi:DNA-binding response OmpR family regulator